MRWSPFVLASVCVLTIASAQAIEAPKVSISTLAQLQAPLPYPYDESANPNPAIAAAFERATKSGKRVLIDFGGNWCPDCRVLAGVMQLPEVKAFVGAHYEIVAVDVGRFDKNLDIVQRYGVTKLAGVPTVVIADASGKPVNVTNSAELANAREMSPQGIADWLARWAGK